jgi:hypothetical protein
MTVVSRTDPAAPNPNRVTDTRTPVTLSQGQAPADDRLPIVVLGCGLHYADTSRQRCGDFVRLAFLPFFSLDLEIEPNCPSLREEILTHAANIQALRGQAFQVSTCGQTVILGRR